MLQLLPMAEQRLPLELRPERMWNQKWEGVWYVLIYDVPEKDKGYRDALRRFLSRHRMGGMQRSVWVSVRDVRPLYADLVTAAGVGSYAVLFQARTVLGQDAREIVRMAWNMDRLEDAQRWYCRTTHETLEGLRSSCPARSALLSWAREELSSYLTIMANDPLLPSELWPIGYAGQDAVTAHRAFQRGLAEIL